MIQPTLNLLLQLLFVSLVTAKELAVAGHGNAWQYGAGGGIVGFIVLVLDIMVFSTYSTSFLLRDPS